MKKDPNNKNFQQALILLKKEYLKANNFTDYANTRWFLKTIFLLFLLISFYVATYFAESIPSYFLLLFIYAVFAASLVLNTVHDASHYVIFKSKEKNNWVRNLSFCILGNSPHLWWQEHVIDHHPVTNIVGEDLGIIETPLLRFHEEQDWKPYHKYQHLYAPLLYCIHMTDFYFHSEFGKVNGLVKKNKNQNILFWFVTCKMTHLVFLLLFPLLFSPFSAWIIVSGFLFIQMIHSWILIYFLGISHLNDKVPFYKNKEDANKQSWVASQIESAVDYGVQNRLLTNMLGSFNVHIIHHLLPATSHVHLNALMPAFKKLCDQYGYDYKACSFFELLQSHFRLLKKMGKGTSERLLNSPDYKT